MAVRGRVVGGGAQGSQWPAARCGGFGSCSRLPNREFSCRSQHFDFGRICIFSQKIGWKILSVGIHGTLTLCIRANEENLNNGIGVMQHAKL